MGQRKKHTPQLKSKAVLSDASTNAYDRITISGQVNNMVGTKIADDKSDFFDGSFDAAVTYTAGSTAITTGYNVWTGSTSGGLTKAGNHCNSWTDGTMGNNGEIGTSNVTTTPLDSGYSNCMNFNRIYCIDGQ